MPHLIDVGQTIRVLHFYCCILLYSSVLLYHIMVNTDESRDIGRKVRVFLNPCLFTFYTEGNSLGIVQRRLGIKKTRITVKPTLFVGYRMTAGL